MIETAKHKGDPPTLTTSLNVDPKRLRHVRLERAITQDELAELAEVHSVTICRIETGKQSATLATIRRLAKALEVLPTDIATITETASA
jgi:DNA-binding XRE family transcriptional regulator